MEKKKEEDEEEKRKKTVRMREVKLCQGLKASGRAERSW